MASRPPVISEHTSHAKACGEVSQGIAWGAFATLGFLLVVAYANSLAEVVRAWETPQYSHGFLAPLFALILLWLRRTAWHNVATPERWLGVGVLGLGLVMRLLGTYFTTFTVDSLSLLVCLAGVAMLVGGISALRWAGPPILFLAFMYPWPDVLVTRVMQPLKGLATQLSLFSLQTLGIEAYAAGNVIELGDGTRMNIVEACSGLNMLTVFLALAAAIALLLRWRPSWERMAIFTCAVPIALIANALRITVSGLLYAFSFTQAAQFFHDWIAPYFMMLAALGLLGLANEFLRRIVIKEDATQLLRASIALETQPGERRTTTLGLGEVK